MAAEAFEHAGHLSGSFGWEEPAQGFILHAADVEFTACDGGEQGFVAGIEQVETGVGTALVVHRLREPVELVTAVARILDHRQELQVASWRPPGSAAAQAGCRSSSASMPTWFLCCHHGVLPRGSA